MLLIFKAAAMDMEAMAAMDMVAVLVMATVTVTVTATGTMDTAPQQPIVTLTPGSTTLILPMHLPTKIQLAGGVPTNNIDLPSSHTAPTISTRTSMGNATSSWGVSKSAIQRSEALYSLLRSPGRLFRSEAPSIILEIRLALQQLLVSELVSTRMAIWAPAAMQSQILGNSTH